jgi:hypothetical protein
MECPLAIGLGEHLYLYRLAHSIGNKHAPIIWVYLYLIATAHYLMGGGGETGHHGHGRIAIAKEVERGDVLRNGYAAIVRVDGGELVAGVIIGGNTTAASGKQQHKEKG